MSSASEQLDHLHRIHDDQPDAAAAGLRALDCSALSADQLAGFAFLVNHVLGEKLGQWSEACQRIAPLAARADAPLALLRQHAVAARCAGDAAQARTATAALARRAQVDVAQAALLVRVCALNFSPSAKAEELATLANRAAGIGPSALDPSFGAAFNNVTNGVYYATRQQPVKPGLRRALLRGADAALLFWSRAGGWMEHERALYLCAKVALRAGELSTAAAAAERGLAIVATQGNDPAERAFLLQLQAAVAERAGLPARAAELRADVARLAASLDDGIKSLLAQDAAEFPPLAPAPKLAFIGGGNLATALMGGLQREGMLAALHVVEIDAARRAQLERDFGATTAAAPDAALSGADVIVLAVKPQQMHDVCTALRPHVGRALLLSVAAGIRAVDIARWSGSTRVVRAMPNTPALIGEGISGLAALPAVSAAERELAERILGTAGAVLWFDDEAQLDPVTAISGSGPAYVFRFIEALQQAAHDLGFTDTQARQLAIATFTGAAQLAAQSGEPVSVLRERVTSKGGTTAAALARMEAGGLAETIVAGAKAANARAREMADEFGNA
jgi:pyrroline-5-carboxylate reductase